MPVKASRSVIKPANTHASETVSLHSVPVDEACVRSLAADSDINIEGQAGRRDPRAPEVSNVAMLRAHRGALDAIALKHAHHDSALHQQLVPADALTRAIFNIFEQERYESIGCNKFAGVQLNLDARSASGTSSGAPSLNETLAPVDPAIARVLQATHALCKAAFRLDVQVVSSAVNTTEYASLRSVFGDHMMALADSLHDQSGFAPRVLTLIDQWLTANANDDLSGQALQGKSEQNPQDSSDGDEGDECEESDSDDLMESDEQSADADDAPREGEKTSSEAEGESFEGDAMADRQVDEAPGSGRDPLIHISGNTDSYKAYTTEFDEICHASEFADKEALAEWRLQLDDHIDVHSRLVRRLASKLQRVLLASQRRHWQFDMEEGHLDSARLSRIVSEPLVPLSFKSESEAPMRDTAITLLIDNSRSMLGRPIMIAAAATDILARTLERCGVSVEILGFTTVHLHGGSSTRLWESRGKPENPGRLNDLRHIVYKSADTSYRSSRRQLGLMLDRDILKQNIDGEALLWANQRLLKRPEQRRILMMISDGAPVDTSTLGANPGDYLSNHLHTVIKDIERAGVVELLAIGIGHDVSRYYSQALSVFDVRQLGPAMLNKLESLLRKAA
ncbi:MAG: hypothetical protein AB8B97_04205 [Granulosicoccus sp.]